MRTDFLDLNPRSVRELAAAGFAETKGRATTIDGLKYQFFRQPKIHRRGAYDNLFPSASLKFKAGTNLDAQLGFSSNLGRPAFRGVAGVWVINDDILPVGAPNTGLQPETSRNLAARLASYFEPVGMLAANVYQNSLRDLFINSRLTAAEFGY